MSAYLTPDQFKEILGEIRGLSKLGLGAAPGPKPKLFGLGSCDCQGNSASVGAEVTSMLAGGSPRLALAKARGIPLAPQTMNVRALFPNTTTTLIPDVGSDEKITQDLLVDALVVRVSNQSLTANQNQFQSLSDFFFGFTSGIEATMSITGAPRYTPVDRFTPLSNIADVVNGQSHWPYGWILTYQQQIKMDFNARILLPFAPVEVVCTFRTWQPVTQSFVTMTTREAIGLLKEEFAIELSDAYTSRVIAMN